MTGDGGRTAADRDRPFVEYCVNDVAGADRARLAALDVPTRGYPCLERCGTCRTETFLVVDGAVRTAESHAALRERFGGDEP